MRPIRPSGVQNLLGRDPQFVVFVPAATLATVPDMRMIGQMAGCFG
jgi:hypothetical protein